MIEGYRFQVANILEQAGNTRRNVDFFLAQRFLLCNNLFDVGEGALEAVLHEIRLVLPPQYLPSSLKHVITFCLHFLR